jgi:hypothetical protein
MQRESAVVSTNCFGFFYFSGVGPPLWFDA